MDSLIETFHIDAGLLLAQMANFAVVVAVLYFFVFKPLLRVMEERKKRIEDGLRFAKQAEDDLKNAQSKGEQVVLEARRCADGEIESAKRLAEEKKKGILESAQAEAERTIATAKAMGESERKHIIGQSKGDILDLAFAAAAAALGKKVGEAEDKKFSEQIIKEL